MKHRANKDNTVYTMSNEPFLIRDWEVVELILEHKTKAIIRFDGIQMQVDKNEFHNNFDLIPDRIEQI